MPDVEWLALIFLGIPVCIIAQAWIRNAWKPKVPPESEEGIDRPKCKEEIAFHQGEFTSLKSEIAELIKATAANFQYAVLASAGVFTWIATAEKIPEHVPIVPLKSEMIRYAVWLPFMISGLFCSLSAALYIRIREIAKYLRKLEDALGFKKLGWEKAFLGHPGTLGPIYLYGWIFLLFGDWLLAKYLPDLSRSIINSD